MSKTDISSYDWRARNPQDKSHIRLTYVTHFYLTNNNPDNVFALLRRYAAMDARMLDQIQFVIVDDGSPLKYEIPDFGLNLLWLKIREDIPWNQAGSRNLGTMYAKSDKMLITDIDREFPEHTLAYMVKRGQCGRSYFKIRQLDRKTGRIGKGHSNTFLISRARVVRFFGYDEEFAGAHGADDHRFTRNQKYHGSLQRYLPKRFYCYRRDDITWEHHNLDRSDVRNSAIDKRKAAEIRRYGGEFGYSRMFLKFTWDKVLDVSRPINWEPPLRPWWIRFWNLRSLTGYS